MFKTCMNANKNNVLLAGEAEISQESAISETCIPFHVSRLPFAVKPPV